MHRHFTDIQKVNEHMRKMCSTSLANSQMKIETPGRYHYTSLRTANRKTTTTNTSKHVDKLDQSYIPDLSVKGYCHSGKQAVSFKIKNRVSIQPSNGTLGHLFIPREMKTCFHLKICRNILSSFIHNRQKLKTIQTSLIG